MLSLSLILLSILSNAAGFVSQSYNTHFKYVTPISVSDQFMENDTKAMIAKAKDNILFADHEIESALESFKQLAILADKPLNYPALKDFISNEAHLNFKSSFHRTNEAASKLRGIIGDPSDQAFQKMFDRVLLEGNWEKAALHASLPQRSSDSDLPASKPWAVLVTGLNGIRKTTTINSIWFQHILYEALGSQLSNAKISKDELPTGYNSFFRQLDFIIATVANIEFKRLYTINAVESYAAFKNAIFSRYRTLAEVLGMLLALAAKEQKMNVLVETSGRDIGNRNPFSLLPLILWQIRLSAFDTVDSASFEYMDYLFPTEQYNKLVVHFTINDIKFAERSVDSRMIGEMSQGSLAILPDGGGVLAQIRANAGGPYGPGQLKSVQRDSDAVLGSVLSGQNSVGRDWFKARILISASDKSPWTVRADTEGSTIFLFPTRWLPAKACHSEYQVDYPWAARKLAGYSAAEEVVITPLHTPSAASLGSRQKQWLKRYIDRYFREKSKLRIIFLV